MSVTFQAVADTMADLKLSKWAIKSRSGSLMGYERTNKDVDSSINRLRRVLEQCQDDMVRVELNPNPKEDGPGGDNKKVIKFDVDLSTLKTVSGVPSVVSSSESKELKELREKVKALELAAIEQKYQAQIIDLNKKIDGIKEDDPIGRLIETITPVLAAYLPQMLGAKIPPPAINGPANDADQERIESAISVLIDVVPDFPTVLEKLATMARNEPEKVKMLITYL